MVSPAVFTCQGRKKFGQVNKAHYNSTRVEITNADEKQTAKSSAVLLLKYQRLQTYCFLLSILSQEEDAVLVVSYTHRQRDMAASSSTSSSATKKYDVFISFRGEDTRYNFTSHLCSALHEHSISVYIDYEFKKGDDISPSLTQAIQDSYGSLIVFSENYASSKWCFNGLLEILKCRKQGHFVIPVFYNVDRSHVRKQTASYGKAFEKLEQDSNSCKEKLNKWKVALSEAANIVGWDSESRTNRDESELIHNIVKDVGQKLNCIYQPKSSFVGIHKRCEYIESLLQRFPIVGIWGMAGIGKTTIARAVFGKLFSQYDSCYFFENVREETNRRGLNYIRDRLRSALLKDEIMDIKHAARRLISKKVFIVFDDVDSSRQLEWLQQELKFLGPESRVIVTTRDKHSLTRLEHEIYEVEGLSFGESLGLFQLEAFNEKYPKIGYEDITEKSVTYAKGIPLFLKVLALHRSQSKEQWESRFQNCKEVILEVLRSSFEELDDMGRMMFLDIACFWSGEQVERVVHLADSYGYFGRIGIRILQDKTLVTLSDSKVIVHDLMKQMGQEIVRRESVNAPEKRSRLWNSKEVYDVLKNNKGTAAIEAIALDVSQIGDLELNANTFKKMTRLRFIKVYSSYLVESPKIYLRGDWDIEPISNKLRYFYWNGYPSSPLPTFCTEKLVVLRMPNSHIKRLWDGVQNLVNLNELDLHGCKQLMELPDFSMAPNLEVVLIYHCSSLREVHPSLLCLHSLVCLNLSFCISIKSLQSEIHLRSLHYLNVEGCFSLKEFSLSSEEMRELDLSDTAIEVLMPSIGHFNKMEKLYLGHAIKRLPNELSLLKSVEVLSISNAEELDTWNLDIIFDGLQSLKSLLITSCISLYQLPINIDVLSSLTTLSLNGSNVEDFPASIKHFSCLENLDISNCRMLMSLPELPPSIKLLEASNCTSMEKVVTSRAYWMKLTNCVRVDEDSIYSILDDFHSRMKQGLDINVCLPGNGVPMWFIHPKAHASITIDLPPRSDLLGFAFCLIVCPLMESQISIIEFECCLEDGETVRELTSWCADEFADRGLVSSDDYMADTKLITDHVYLWYKGQQSKAILKAVENSRVNRQHAPSNLKLSFQFSAYDDQNRKLENVMIKECGVLPIYASENDNSVNELGYRTHDIDEQKQLFHPTSENFEPSFLPLELQFDELRISTIESGIASFEFDHPDQDMSTQNARQDLPEINSSCLLNRFSELDYSTSQMEVSLMKSKRCLDMDDNQQLQRKKFNRCKDMDELLRGASTSGFGVGCPEFTYSAGSFEVSKMDNKTKECGVWSIYAPEYDSSIEEMDLDHEIGNIDEQVQFFDLTTKDVKLALLPVELDLELGDKSERCWDMNDHKIRWSISAPGYDSSFDEMDLDCKIDNVDEEVQFFDPTTKDFNLSLLPVELEFCTKSERCKEIDELEPKQIGKGVEGSAFHHQNKDEQRSLLPAMESMESVSQPLATHISRQNDTDYLSEKFSCACLIGLLWKCLWRLSST